VSFGTRPARACFAELAWTADGTEAARVVLAAGGREHVVVVDTVYDPAESKLDDPRSLAWKSSVALLRTFAPTPDQEARGSAGEFAPLAFSGACPRSFHEVSAHGRVRGPGAASARKGEP
jgi:hypothetical protein